MCAENDAAVWGRSALLFFSLLFSLLRITQHSLAFQGAESRSVSSLCLYSGENITFHSPLLSLIVRFRTDPLWRFERTPLPDGWMDGCTRVYAQQEWAFIFICTTREY